MGQPALAVVRPAEMKTAAQPRTALFLLLFRCRVTIYALPLLRLNREPVQARQSI